ncbi:colorectal mutant cancer protein [Biomphalaria glabrata]|nr:colorectal mutant cancer protein-like [Biomphalaria glabrata]
MIAYEKFKRLEEGCPVRSLVDNWQDGNRLKRNSFMHSVRKLSKEVDDLPKNRAALALHGASSPANAPGIPEVRKSIRSAQKLSYETQPENCHPVPSRLH